MLEIISIALIVFICLSIILFIKVFKLRRNLSLKMQELKVLEKIEKQEKKRSTELEFLTRSVDRHSLRLMKEVHRREESEMLIIKKNELLLGQKRKTKEYIKTLQKIQSELKEQKNALEQINIELKDFAHIVSHDLKAPLRAIIQLSTWIKDDYIDKLDDENKENLFLLVEKARQMNNLIDGILQYSRAGTTMLSNEKIDLNQLFEDVVNFISCPEHISIIIENKLPVIVADKIRIGQVFQNLLSNSIKYMDKDKGEIKIGCVKENDFWKFHISDNGMGIEKKYENYVFKIFGTSQSAKNKESSGIGLSIVKKIVELYNGKIWYESTVKKGTIFYFTLKG